jgi:hypothetical protein
MKNHALKSDARISATLNKYCNLITSKMGKTWHFIFATVDTLKQNFLLLQGHKKKTQRKLLSHNNNENKTKKVNTTGLPPVKRILYSHIARLHYLFLSRWASVTRALSLYL